jgi:plastocyanin
MALGTLAAVSHTGAATLSGNIRVFLRDQNGELVLKSDASSAVVYLTGFSQPPPEQTPRISQKNKTFVPDVLPIVVGQSVEFTNDDKIIHNVFSTSKARTFDLGKPRAGESRTIQFDQTGVVELYCDIHEEMAATVLVLPNRAFAVTAPDGRFTLTGIPPGHWALYAWSRRSDPVRIEVDVSDAGGHPINLDLVETRFDSKHLGKYGQPYRKQRDYLP